MKIENQSIRNKTKKDLLEVLYQRYGRKLYAYATMSWKLDEDGAWDLIYKTLYKVVDSQQDYQFEHEKQFAAFVFKVFVNYLRNHYRDNKKLSEKLQLIRMEEQEFDQTAEIEVIETKDNRHMEILKEVLMDLEDWQRVLLLMRSEGHSYAEIAKFINKPEEQLKVYYQRLKATLSKKINEQVR
ncbi:MAG: sigma-70 family RNA polymerase sigma factor [Bacteroidia bacterium]|nr:sigma-70 family RNA polymerase sigma factor [Bacteroidia bacterium]